MKKTVAIILIVAILILCFPAIKNQINAKRQYVLQDGIEKIADLRVLTGGIYVFKYQKNEHQAESHFLIIVYNSTAYITKVE
jgi:hypothetical protein